MLLPKGTPYWYSQCDVPKNQPAKQPDSFWDVLQKASLLFGFALTVKQLSE